MVEAPELVADEVGFVVLPDGSVIIDDDLPEPAIEPLAEELDNVVEAPYRVEAVRRHGQAGRRPRAGSRCSRSPTSTARS